MNRVKLFNCIRDAAAHKELPTKMRALFNMSVLKNNSKYYELRNSDKDFAVATVNVIYFRNDNYPIMIIAGYNDKYQDFYYDGFGWNILSTQNPENEWKEKEIELKVPKYLKDNFAEGNTIGFLEDAVEFIEE